MQNLRQIRSKQKMSDLEQAYLRMLVEFGHNHIGPKLFHTMLKSHNHIDPKLFYTILNSHNHIDPKLFYTMLNSHNNIDPMLSKG